MGKSSPRAPAAPDPVATAQAQANANVDAARSTAALNRVNQYTPTGSITWRNVGQEDFNRALAQRHADYQAGRYQPNYGVDSFGAQVREGWRSDLEEQRLAQEMGTNRDRWESVTTLSPNQQRLMDLTENAQLTYGQAANDQLQQVRGMLSRPVDASALDRYGDPNISRERVEQALLYRMRPQMDQTRVAMEARLRNQGLQPDSEAWVTSMRDLGRQENDATMAAILSAGQEQNRLQALRQQGLQEILALRAQPLNEAAALLTGQQISMPQFSGAPQVNVSPADITSAFGMQQAAQQQAYQGRVANQQANNAAAAGAATAAISAAAIIA